MERFDPAECCRLVEGERITILFAVPPVLVALLQHPGIEPPT
jgi:acyl-CoA synthetase (AMP-forming)/AMP-acid ligase II